MAYGANGARLLALLAAIVLTMAGCGSKATNAPATPSPVASASPAPLRILLVNDDGWQAPGLTALREALTAAGNDVTVVAPAGNESGTGASLTFVGTLQVAQQQPKVWSVSGRPADSALVGLKSVLADNPPDLVVSGINTGYNLASTSIHSGTVGAALTAVEFGVPAIAVSTDLADLANPVAADFVPVADYLARLIESLSSGQKPLLPTGGALNINYPQGTDKATGVSATSLAPAPQVELGYVESGPGRLTPKPDPVSPSDPQGDTDMAAIARGEVSVSGIGVGLAAGPDVLAAATAAARAAGP